MRKFVTPKKEKLNFLQMLKKGSKLYSILTGTCPKCQNESMYLDKNPLHLNKILKMHENCSHCGLHYQIEPSFFYGAMYVSYGLNVGIGVAAFIISFLFLGSSLKVAFIVIIVSLLISFPFVLRWARNIYINMFVSYDSKNKLK
ncbi:uncharacterized protein (DUF983 family) [Flavobacterium sp. CG_9.1]|nr:uncharacterized protein (DUF983 family) [Flavobacterium sp. CG_9.1]